eukprot:scaffold31245_cov115-Isochrysis_galbana.AAC.1
MAPRRPGTQPTEADLTLDIGAKRARVEGEDESSMQVQLRARTRASKSACTCLTHILAWLLLWLSVRRGSSLPQRDHPPSIHQLRLYTTNHLARGSASVRCAPERSAAPCALRAAMTIHGFNYLRTPTLSDPQDLEPSQTAIDLFQPTAEELAGLDERHNDMTADSLVRARSLAPTPTPSTTTTTSDTALKSLVHHVPPHKARVPPYKHRSHLGQSPLKDGPRSKKAWGNESERLRAS